MRTKHLVAMLLSIGTLIWPVLPSWAQADSGGSTGGTASALGTTSAPVRQKNQIFVRTGGAIAGFGGPVQILAGEGSIMGRKVTGKPFSADAVTKTTQILADGNRITHTNRARIYRDSEGRMRREQTLNGIGPWKASNAQPVTIITINDPVKGVSYMLDPNKKIAHELPALKLQAGGRAARAPTQVTGIARPDMAISIRRRVRIRMNAKGGPDIASLPSLPPLPIGGKFFGEILRPSQVTTSTQDLGDEVLQGVLAHGTQQTQTIAAGAIGNEEPIKIVTEQWYSSDLGALMQRTNSDPRFGTTTYKLINVDRSEPPPDLFAVPQGYTIDKGGPVMIIRRGHGKAAQASGP